MTLSPNWMGEPRVATHHASTIILRRPDGTILMQLRDDGQGKSIPYPNMWNFPGGIIEPGETPLAAAIREIAEEFEIRLDPAACCKLWAYAHDQTAEDHIFICEVPAEARPVLHEGAAFAWMTLEQIAQLELGFEQARILAHIPSNPEFST